ncbi:MAG: hypothetical protein IT577_15350 [Verrucomicrobiae bacterium]|nr:hypothetical protein [Verrucomicrobiae bacterium]
MCRFAATVALAIAAGPCLAPAQGLSKYADPNWNPNMETNKASSLAGKTFSVGKGGMGDRKARIGDGDVKLKAFPVKQWSAPEATGIKERAAHLTETAPVPLKSSPYANKGFTPARGRDTSKLQKAYPIEASKFSGQAARGLDTDKASKEYEGRSAADLQAIVDRTLTRTLTVDEVKKLLNEPGSSAQPTAETKPAEASPPGQR